MRKITQKQLKSVVHYDPKTGVFTWRSKRGCRAEGSEAGYLEESGLRRIRIFTTSYYARRMAWLYVHGTLPRQVRFKNATDKDDNRLCNLYALD